jgi:hypothetical protein
MQMHPATALLIIDMFSRFDFPGQRSWPQRRRRPARSGACAIASTHGGGR